MWRHKYLRTSALIFAGDNFVFQAIFLTFIVVAHGEGIGGGVIGVLIAACVLPVAFVGPWLNAVVIGYRTAVTPDHLLGRVSSVARSIALLAEPLGPLVALVSTLSPSIRDSPSLDELATPSASLAAAD